MLFCCVGYIPEWVRGAPSESTSSSRRRRRGLLRSSSQQQQQQLWQSSSTERSTHSSSSRSFKHYLFDRFFGWNKLNRPPCTMSAKPVVKVSTMKQEMQEFAIIAGQVRNAAVFRPNIHPLHRHHHHLMSTKISPASMWIIPASSTGCDVEFHDRAGDSFGY